MAPLFILKDDVESINFIDGVNYKLADDSLVLSTPDKKEYLNENAYFADRDLVRMQYGTRSVEFQFYALGSTIEQVSATISKVQRILTRATNHSYLRGGYFGAMLNETTFQNHITYDNGSTTGDHGVVLQIRRGSDTISSIKQESNNSTVSNIEPVYTLRVLSGNVEIREKTFASTMQTADGKYYKNCYVTIKAEPFIVGPSRIISSITDGNGLYSGASLNTGLNQTQKSNRIFLSASDVPGDVDALTRIVTNLQNSQGLIIARDAGISALNCPSVPARITGTGKADFFLFGQVRNNDVRPFRIRITGTGTPNTFAYAQRALNSNSYTFGSSINMTPNTPQKLGDREIYIVWLSSSGHTLNDEWQFDPHQAYFKPGTTINLNTADYAPIYSELGTIVYSTQVNIPPGCRGKYKFISSVLNSQGLNLEYQMKVQFIGYEAGFGATEPQFYEWTGLYIGSTIDFGVIDLTSVSAPFLSHPYSSIQMNISIMVRTMQTITSTSNFQIIGCHLIPVQDEFAYMQAGWRYDGSGYEVYSNYDPSNPYIAEESANFINNSGNNASGKLAVGLDATYGGNIITLQPGVEQTLLFVPLFGVTSDWRAHTIISNGRTGSTYVAIRPRYLHLPG
jgi:hypothetical protein